MDNLQALALGIQLQKVLLKNVQIEKRPSSHVQFKLSYQLLLTKCYQTVKELQQNSHV